jgi:hypothetical protein
MKELKAIDPVSLGKLMAIVNAIIGLIVGIIFALFASIFLAAIPTGVGVPYLLPFALGAFAVIAFPILFAIAGFIWGVVVAFLYNVVAKRFGGVKLDL